MTPPIFTPDGTEVEEVIMPDGSEASEVIAPDGTVVFDAIPGSDLTQYSSTGDAYSEITETSFEASFSDGANSTDRLYGDFSKLDDEESSFKMVYEITIVGDDDGGSDFQMFGLWSDTEDGTATDGQNIGVGFRPYSEDFRFCGICIDGDRDDAERIDPIPDEAPLGSGDVETYEVTIEFDFEEMQADLTVENPETDYVGTDSRSIPDENYEYIYAHAGGDQGLGGPGEGEYDVNSWTFDLYD